METPDDSGGAFERWIERDLSSVDALAESQFNELFLDWLAHARTDEMIQNSATQYLIHCQPYRSIVRMGRGAIQFIRKAYDLDSSNNDPLLQVQKRGLFMAVYEIMGDDFPLPERDWLRMETIRDYTKLWLDEYLQPM